AASDESARAPSARAPRRALQRLTLAAAALFLVGLAHAHRPTVAESPEARVARRFQAQVASGEALNLTLEDREGGQRTLESLRGQVVLVNFWASWCPPCLKEMPDLEGLARDMDGRPFTLVALSGDDSWQAVDGALGGRAGKMQVFRDPNLKDKQHLRYGTEKLPETYVIDKQGRLRLRFINVQPWQSEEIVSYLQWLTNE
ncbi:MAG: TlpA family protein disulfide reductase, partial [Deltaproteobacteria bacterium]|nr:TlpA family protein disulfide reductase [Deltaproteobacteria bacterium]